MKFWYVCWPGCWYVCCWGGGGRLLIYVGTASVVYAVWGDITAYTGCTDWYCWMRGVYLGGAGTHGVEVKFAYC